MQKYKSNITTTSGAAVRNVPVTVLKEDGALASLFLDRYGHVAAPNPLKTGRMARSLSTQRTAATACAPRWTG